MNAITLSRRMNLRAYRWALKYAEPAMLDIVTCKSFLQSAWKVGYEAGRAVQRRVEKQKRGQAGGRR